MVKYSHGKWWMTYDLSGETGSLDSVAQGCELPGTCQRSTKRSGRVWSGFARAGDLRGGRDAVAKGYLELIDDLAGGVD